MAKKIDTTKLDRIREASVEIISESGILNCPVASIARRAGVSVGYLYRHYPSKVELINDLLEEALNAIAGQIDTLMAGSSDIRTIVNGIVSFIIESAEKNRAKHKFLIMLLNDFSVGIKPETQRRIREIAHKLIETGQKNKVLRNGISANDLYLALVGIPMQFLAAEYRFDFGERQSGREELIRRITDVSLNLIQ